MAYTIFDKVYDDYIASHGGEWNEDLGKQAEQAAWSAYNSADTKTRDKQWGSIYEAANDMIADKSGKQLKTQEGKYKIEADKRKGKEQEGKFNTDDDSYTYTSNDELYDSNGNLVTDRNLIEQFQNAKNESESVFGRPESGASNYDYYKEHGVSFQDAASKLGAKDPLAFNQTLQEGSGNVRAIHNKGIDDLNLRYSPDVDPYTQQDVSDMANIISNDEIYGWKSGYSNNDNKMTDTKTGQRITPQAYAQREMIDNPTILEDEFAKGNYEALANIADYDTESMRNYADAIAGWGGGYLSDSDKKLLSESGSSLAEIAQSAKDKYEKNKDSDELEDADKAEMKNDYEAIDKIISTNADRLLASALAQSIASGNNYFMDTNQSTQKGNLLSNAFSGKSGSDLYDTDQTDKYFNIDLINPDQNAVYTQPQIQIPNILNEDQFTFDKYFDQVYQPNTISFLPEQSIQNALRRYGYNIKRSE